MSNKTELKITVMNVEIHIYIYINICYIFQEYKECGCESPEDISESMNQWIDE